MGIFKTLLSKARRDSQEDAKPHHHLQEFLQSALASTTTTPGPPPPPSNSAPNFPSVYPYGNNSPSANYPNSFGDLPQQFSGLSINGSPNGPPPPGPPYNAGSSPGPAGSLAVPDYSPLRNPLPRPPAIISIPTPEPYNPNPFYVGAGPSFQPQPPALPHSNSAPNQQGLWNGYSATSLAPTPSGQIQPPTGRASSVPPTSSNNTAPSSQCAGITKTGKRCTRTVRTAPFLVSLDPDADGDIPRYCHQHGRDLMVVTGMYSFTSPQKWIEFGEFIPSYLSEGTRTALQSEMAKPISQSDVEGYIYCYELRDKTKPDIINLKVGRAVNLVKRIDEWTKSCESKEPVLRGWWPGPDDSHHATSMVKGLVMAGAKGKNCHRLERLIHLELADLVVLKPYLTDEFDTANTASKPKRGSNTPSKSRGKARAKDDDEDDEDDTPKAKTKSRAKKQTPKRKPKRKSTQDDDEDEDDDEDDDDDDDGSKDSVPSTPSSSASSRSTPGKKAKAPKMPTRQPCKDCGAVHKEIFTFTRWDSGPHQDREWEDLVQPVMERWGKFVDTYT